MNKVNVDLNNRSYDIFIGSGILTDLGQEMANLSPGKKVLLVTNTSVAPLYTSEVLSGLKYSGCEVSVLELPDGEYYKNLDTATSIYDAAVEAGLDRYSTIIALGGGVVGDMAGFAAATYMRGINFVQIPTTLLAQVDSSVGGKVAVNHPRGKNLIGAFYQPKLVWADVATLKTLPMREIKAGLAEVIKYGVINDEDFFAYLENHVDELSDLQEEALIKIVEKSCEIKAQVVSADEQEQGVRAILNFGHTIGHALEAATHYKQFRHGEAVAIGMVGAAYVAHEMGMLSTHERDRIKELIARMGLPISYSDISWETIWHHMQADKKVKNGEIIFVLPSRIGTVEIVPVEKKIIKKAVLAIEE